MHAEEAENAETTINAGIAEGRSVPASCDEPTRFVAPDTPGGRQDREDTVITNACRNMWRS